MNREAAIKVANAVLYEGYMLYPYRHSAMKNRQRWTFGILYPPQYDEVGSGTERCVMHSECLLQVRGDSKLEIQLRFLHLLSREVRVIDGERQSEPLLIDDQLIESRDEGVERSVDLEVQSLEGSHAEFRFSFPHSCTTEAPARKDDQRRIVIRTQHEITGSVSLRSEAVGTDLLKLSLDVTNTTPLPLEEECDRNAALLRSMLSAHLILAAYEAEFVSLLDPPNELREEAGTCRNVGNFPVLVGAQDKNERDMLLCSPIILYDYPQVAPESAGDFFDATEMDEMLTLRVMTLTESEKNEVRLAGDQVRQLLDRTEQSTREQLARTHGTIRYLGPISEEP